MRASGYTPRRLAVREPFLLECGTTLPALEVAYTTAGAFVPGQTPVIWLCHALTGNADPQEWWPGLVGEGKLLDPRQYFIVCANMLGSCYGTTGPASPNPQTGLPYGEAFPPVSIRDMVSVHQLLARHLGIGRIHLLIGGSMGGQQALEWAVTEPARIDHLCVLATNAQHSPWGIAFNEAQRMAIEAAGGDKERGLEVARAIAMLSYRSYQIFQEKQQEPDLEKMDNFRAVTYLHHQGQKLRRRFDVQSYLTLSRAMDSHNLGRKRGGHSSALARIRAKTMVLGIQSDMLFPPSEQAFLARHIPGAQLHLIESPYGHDGFLVEVDTIRRLLSDLLPEHQTRSESKRVRERNRLGLPGSESF